MEEKKSKKQSFLTFSNKVITDIDKAKSKRPLTKTEKKIRKRVDTYLKIWGERFNGASGT